MQWLDTPLEYQIELRNMTRGADEDYVTGESVVVAQETQKGYVQPVLVRTCHSITCTFKEKLRIQMESFECTQVSLFLCRREAAKGNKNKNEKAH